MNKWDLVLWGFVIGAVLTAFFLAYQSVSGGFLSQSTPPGFAPTLGPTTAYTAPSYQKLDSVYQDTAVASFDQIEVRPTPTGTPTAYTNAQEWVVSLVNHSGGNTVVNLRPNHDLVLSDVSGSCNQQTYVCMSFAEVQGSVVLLEGGSILFQAEPKKGLSFTIIAESQYPEIEQHNWNTANTRIFGVFGGVSAFPQAPWGQVVEIGDVLEVETPKDGSPLARYVHKRGVPLGSGGQLYILSERPASGGYAGALYRSLEEMRGGVVIIEDNLANNISNIDFGHQFTPFTIPEGWYMDFYNREDTPLITENFFGRGQVIWTGAGQTWTHDPDASLGPYKAGSWYRILAIADNKLHVSWLNKPYLPTATPAPTATPQPAYVPPRKSWHQMKIAPAQLADGHKSDLLYDTCGGSPLANWAGTNRTANQASFWVTSSSEWERIKTLVYRNGLYYTEEISHPGTATNGSNNIQIAGTPIPINPQEYPISTNIGTRLWRTAGTTVILYNFDRRGGARTVSRTLGDFSASDITVEDICFVAAWEWR